MISKEISIPAHELVIHLAWLAKVQKEPINTELLKITIREIQKLRKALTAAKELRLIEAAHGIKEST